MDLKISLEAVEGLENRMTVTIPAETIEREVNNRLKSVGSKAKLKGFRPGKAPLKIIQQHYGEGIRQEVLNEMVQSSYSAAIDEKNLKPAAMPTLEQVESAPGSDFIYTATFEVFPQIELSALDGLEVEKQETEISETDIDEMVENLRAQRVDWKVVQRKSMEGDKITLDFEGSIKGESIEGGSGQDTEIVIGSGQMLEDFENNLIGLTAGEEKTFKLKFPKDYQASEIAGKKADFTIRIKEVAQQELPEIDAEFVKGFGIESGDIESFRQDVRKNMEREAKSMIESDVKQQIMERLLDTNPIEVPSALITNEASNLRNEALRNLGFTEDNASDPNLPSLDSFREAAERRVRLSLLIGAIIDENGLVVDRDRVKDKVEEICAPYEQPEEFKKVYFQNPQLMSQIESLVLEEQVVEWLVSKSKLTVAAKAFGDLRRSGSSMG